MLDRVRTRVSLVALTAFAALASCGDDFFVTQFDIVITTPTSAAQFDTASDTVALGGTLEFTLGIQEDIEVTWRNLTTGTSGPGTVNASVSTWSAGPVPLQDGANQLRVELDADGGWSDAALLTVVYTPLLPVDDESERGAPLRASTLVVPAGVQTEDAPPLVEPRATGSAAGRR